MSLDIVTTPVVEYSTGVDVDSDASVVSKEVGVVVYTPLGSRFFIPNVHNKPILGTVFESKEEAYNFYQQYAKDGGFETKLSSSWNPDKLKDPRIKYFACTKEGKKPPPKKKSLVSEGDFNPLAPVARKRKTSSQRTGCPAKMGVKKIAGNKYVVMHFIEKHNHFLVHESDMQFLKGSRDLGFMKQQFLFEVSNANIGPVKGFKLMKEIYGGFEELGVTSVDCKNFRRDVNQFIGMRDAQMFVDKLLSRQMCHPDFFVEYFCGDDDTLAGIFWCDCEAKRNYRIYGDVVSFDSTFRSNKYRMVLVPFTGIDNHNRCVTFACGLLSRETMESYNWLLLCFKRAFGHAPKVVVTDQDASIRSAILSVFPESRHRYCMWHIMHKLTTKVGHDLCNNTDFKKQICNIVWTDQISPEFFEMKWAAIINEFGLHSNRWLKEMYNIRDRWIPAYLINEPLSGLMRTSSRSESENHFFGKLTNPYLSLVEFLSHYDTAMDSQRYFQQKNDHESCYTNPYLKTNFPMEQHCSEIYTRTLFHDVQDEIIAATDHCLCVTIKRYDSFETYTIRDIEFSVPTEYEVVYNEFEVTVECGCRRFELYGLLCKHIFYVFKMNNVHTFPSKYLLKRWSMDAIPEKSIRVPAFTEETYGIQGAVREMLMTVELTANRLVHDAALFSKYRSQLAGLLKQAKVDVPVVKHLSKNEVICSFLGVKEPDQVNIQNPHSSENKGRKRLKSKYEIEAQKSSKKKLGNQCQKCKGYGHNQRTCSKAKG